MAQRRQVVDGQGRTEGVVAAHGVHPTNLPGQCDHRQSGVQFGQSPSGQLAADAILCNGAGNYAIWPQRFLRFRRYGTQLAPTSGSMGYGLPAAVAAKRGSGGGGA